MILLLSFKDKSLYRGNKNSEITGLKTLIVHSPYDFFYSNNKIEEFKKNKVS